MGPCGVLGEVGTSPWFLVRKTTKNKGADAEDLRWSYFMALGRFFSWERYVYGILSLGRYTLRGRLSVLVSQNQNIPSGGFNDIWADFCVDWFPVKVQCSLLIRKLADLWALSRCFPISNASALTPINLNLSIIQCHLQRESVITIPDVAFPCETARHLMTGLGIHSICGEVILLKVNCRWSFQWFGQFDVAMQSIGGTTLSRCAFQMRRNLKSGFFGRRGKHMRVIWEKPTLKGWERDPRKTVGHCQPKREVIWN